jgi:hypothetical protein
LAVLQGSISSHRVRDERHCEDEDRDGYEDQRELPDASDEHCAEGRRERLVEGSGRRFDSRPPWLRPDRRAEAGENLSA